MRIQPQANATFRRQWHGSTIVASLTSDAIRSRLLYARRRHRCRRACHSSYASDPPHNQAANLDQHTSRGSVWESAKADNFITMDQKADLQLAGTHAVRAACDSIELLAASAGGNAIRQSERFNRQLRDLRTLTQHAYMSADRYEDVGAIALGQPPRWGFLQF